MGIRIDELPPELTLTEEHTFVAMKDGQTVMLTAAQVIALVVSEAFGVADDFPAVLTTELNKRLNKTGGTMTGNIIFSDDAEGINLSQGSRLYDVTTALVMLANGNLLRLFSEDGLTELFRVDNSQSFPKFKGNDIYHSGMAAGSFPASLLPNIPDANISATLTADKAFRRGNVRGTVSQSAGVPTGALMETGSNGNGDFLRFADGTQICRANFTLSNGGTTWTSATWTFPASFNAAPQCFSSMGPPTSNQLIMTACGGANTTQVQYYLNSQSGIVNQTLQTLAVGRWF